MSYVLLWLNIHRLFVVALLGLGLWLSAYVGYFRPIISNYLRRGRAHSWSVDLVGKKAVSRGKTEVQ
jgi:hypothetical protein